MPVLAAPRETTINLRAAPTQKSLIDRAAQALGQSRSSFMLEASLRHAEATLADRTQFTLDATQVARFQRALDAPLPDAEALRRLLAKPAPWSR